ncbi:MinD/ParA family ATP-binding protein [Deinococcus roseus]|uniref:CDP-3, 6-dideoxy-D-glycero-L-glycero-4-hexulose-4-reductase n=1 Tax=Deinococcus roseus TaxID=392414 RepID=A0ABQ2DDI6_9DEIO|nr:AAA family ATPase [Deinococcus roseus]GGJ52047.1 CDP-3, 6-dideoxy-D-glycero-L-glycero-4-hexulose-4-reductase [Deinococcus roseus]
MSKTDPPRCPVITFAAFHRNTGRSTLLAALAVKLCQQSRVLVVDADISAPQMLTLLGLPESRVGFTLNDYLVGLCDLQQAVYDLPDRVGPATSGALYLLPASDDLSVASRTLREEYDSVVLMDDLHQLIQVLQLDFVLIDMPVGISGTTLPLMSLADVLLVVMRIEKKDFEGIGVIVDVASRLDIQHVLLTVNMVHTDYPLQDVKHKFKESFGRETWALPHIAPFSASAEGEQVIEQLGGRLMELKR